MTGVQTCALPIWKVYTRVVMPLSRPVIAAVTVLTFVGVWNNLLLPLYVLSNPGLMTIPVGLATTQGSYGLRYADIQAGALLAALPQRLAAHLGGDMQQPFIVLGGVEMFVRKGVRQRHKQHGKFVE